MPRITTRSDCTASTLLSDKFKMADAADQTMLPLVDAVTAKNTATEDVDRLVFLRTVFVLLFSCCCCFLGLFIFYFCCCCFLVAVVLFAFLLLL